MNVKTFSLKSQGEVKLSNNFTVSEFARWDDRTLAAKYCGDEVKIDLELVNYLQKIRDHFAQPVMITSGYRPAGYNAGIGGENNSYHVYGQAVDFYVSGVGTAEVAKYCESIGVRGIGLYTAAKFIHIDTRIIKYYWRNDGKGNYTVSTHGGAAANKAGNPCADWTSYVKAVQSAIGALADGAAGPRTLAACPTLRQGSTHKAVKPVQHRLNYIGHSCGTADGIFGVKTAAAVKEFQKAGGLTVDGIIGRNTWKKLLGIK